MAAQVVACKHVVLHDAQRGYFHVGSDAEMGACSHNWGWSAPQYGNTDGGTAVAVYRLEIRGLKYEVCNWQLAREPIIGSNPLGRIPPLKTQ